MAHLSLSLWDLSRSPWTGNPSRASSPTRRGRYWRIWPWKPIGPPPRGVGRPAVADWPDRDALNNLRYTLSDLRRVIGDHKAEPPFLLITRDTLQFNPASDYALDVKTFTEMVGTDKPIHQPSSNCNKLSRCIEAISWRVSLSATALALRNGRCLRGNDWPGRCLSALHQLAATHEQRGEYEQAQSCAWRQIELEPRMRRPINN